MKSENTLINNKLIATTEDIPSLWVLKGLCAIFVVLIHIPFYEDRYILPILNIAVPSFFMITGYFLYQKHPEIITKKISTWLKKLLPLIFFLNLFYYICLAYVGNIKTFEDISLTIITGDRICTHLWYLSALFWALVILYFTHKHNAQKYIYFFPVLMIFSILLGRYSFLFTSELWPIYLRVNFLFPALPCISIGYLIKKHQTQIITSAYLPYLFIIFLIMIYIECYTLIYLGLNNNTTYMFSTAPLASTIIALAIKHKDFNISFLNYIGKYHSDKIYYFHIAVSATLTRILYSKYNILSNYSAIIVLLSTIILSIFINYAIKGFIKLKSKLSYFSS